ncbi:mitochondrial nicotinamide adenine dinucleotide transporter SLC25A51-like [Clavelina lepadiformis]|uniref:mitochondrial nicotinamide adenine dinucleotide transporter SLC25A51-like n=1 Tax=Clavelina lepadiformis TaxID=159417 RepID=UPI0040427BE3
MTLGKNNSTKFPKHPQEKYKHFICGGGSSFINIVITFPMNKMMFRQQLYGFRAHKAFKQLWREGFLNLYRGLVPPLFQKSTSYALMFGLYHQALDLITQNYGLGVLQSKLLASLCAGTCEATLAPFERIQTLLLDPKHHKTFRNTHHTFFILYSKYGTKEYFRGLSAILLRNGPSTFIYFSLREPIKLHLPEAEKNTFQNSANDFISGALIGALCSTLFYPVNVVKSKMQSHLGGEFLSFRKTLLNVYYERGCKWKKMYRGIHINFARSIISWGIINAAYEYLMETFYSN